MKYVKWVIRIPVMLIGLPFGIFLALFDIVLSSFPENGEVDEDFHFIFSESYWKAWKP